MTKPKPLPAHLASRPFTLAEAREARLSGSRTKASDLWTPSRGIRVHRAAPFELLESCRPYVEITGSGVVSHTTAAKLHGLYLPSRFDNEQFLHISRPSGLSAPRRKHVAGHCLDLPDGDVCHVGGVRVTSIARTLLDLAALLSVDELVVVADQVVCEHHWDYRPPKLPMVELGRLNKYIAEHGNFRGVRSLRDAMALVRVGADSPPETRLRLSIVRAALPEFLPNTVVRDADGNAMVYPDLGCEEYRTCLEYDGIHHFTPDQQRRDHDRDFITKTLGWQQVLINKEDLRMGSQGVIGKIARQLVLGGWQDPENLAGRSLRGQLGSRRDFG